MKYFLYIILLFCFTFAQLCAQQVTVSKDFSIRNDLNYSLLGKVKENILLYRDQGSEKTIEVFDENLKFLFDKELKLGQKRSPLYGLVKRENDFITFSGYRKKKLYNLIAHRFDENINPLDTVQLIDQKEDFKLRDFVLFVSKNKSKTLLISTLDNNLLYMYVIDNNTLDILWWKEVLIKEFNPIRHFNHAFISDDGDVNVLLYDSNKEAHKGESQFLLVGGSAESVFVNKFLVSKKYIIDVESKFDQLNNRFILTGLASDDREYDADSYFFLSKNILSLEEENIVSHRNFDSEFIEEIYGEKLGKKKRLKDFVTREVIVRKDGGIVLITEMEKEFYRRSSFNTVSRNSESYGRGWVDTYTEDIIIISMNKDGEEDWKKILYKKQFSQDDDGQYSSFFVFKNPSRLRFIYNDEIKNNITVSEYVLDPKGRHERNSLLSTEYQNLKIRWKDAQQIGSGELIAPSENNYKLSLVKVDYNTEN